MYEVNKCHLTFRVIFKMQYFKFSFISFIGLTSKVYPKIQVSSTVVGALNVKLLYEIACSVTKFRIHNYLG